MAPAALASNACAGTAGTSLEPSPPRGRRRSDLSAGASTGALAAKWAQLAGSARNAERTLRCRSSAP
eukprot:5179889-Alexandrium_andersonii.AAC.1